jgi:putative hydrolase of the HAD superfamily
VGRLADLDAVTLDANGTLVEIVDPAPALDRALRARGVERAPEDVRRAFALEARYYAPRSARGGDAPSLAELRRECVDVFLGALGAGLDRDEFVPSFVEAITFAVLPGVRRTIERLRAAGLELAVVGNWDMTLPERLAEAGLAQHLTVVVSSAEAGAAKPDPAPFELALERLAVAPRRALHIGDSAADDEGARAAGIRFDWAPLPRALEAWR